MHALVIGGTGPTGPSVVNGLIERGHRVTILHTGAHEVEFIKPVEHLHGDPNFKETLEETIGNRAFDLVVGMYGRARYVAEVIKGLTPRFIAITAYGYEDGLPQPIPETAPTRKEPKLWYKIWETEQAIMEAHQQGHYVATILRYPWIYGPRQMMPREWSIVKRILDGRKQFILPDSGLHYDSYGYADNAAHATLLTIDHPAKTAGEIYNVRDEQILTIRQRVERITKILDYDWELINIPVAFARPSYPFLFPNASRDAPLFILQHRIIDITKIKTELGYQDVIPVDEALERTVKWLLDNRPEPGGEIEIYLGDSFDYAGEEGLIREFREFSKKAKAVPYNYLELSHGYAHPKKPGQ